MTTNGPVAATGVNGIGIFAQSTGAYAVSGSTILITVNSSVMGGCGVVATCGGEFSNFSQPGSAPSRSIARRAPSNQVTVNSGGSLNTMSGAAGTAILASGGGVVNVTNNGIITGSAYLNPDPGTFTNNGTYNAGAFVQGNLVNNGLVAIGGRTSEPGPLLSFATTTVTDRFAQASTGTLQVGVDFNTGSKPATPSSWTGERS